jgi:hypothetical protein
MDSVSVDLPEADTAVTELRHLANLLEQADTVTQLRQLADSLEKSDGARVLVPCGQLKRDDIVCVLEAGHVGHHVSANGREHWLDD